MSMPSDNPDPVAPATRTVLDALSRGHDVAALLDLHPDLTVLDVCRAAAQGLAALERGGPARVETRDERIARLRLTWPRVYYPWEPDEDERMLTLFDQGAAIAAIARDLGRPPGAVRRRLETLLGADWREKRGVVPGEAAD